MENFRKGSRSFRKEERLRLGERWLNDLDLVFVTPLGTAIDARNLVRRFERHLQDAGLPRIRFHDLRHAAASLLLAQGVEPRTIMQTLGHSQISLTLNTYAHVIPALQQEAADRMDALLGFGST
jgi:integrase